MKFLSSNKPSLPTLSSNKNISFNLTSYITKLLIIIALLNLISKTEQNSSKPKEKKASAKDSLKYLSQQTKNYPDELEEISKILSKKSKECFGEITQIYSKDFSTNEGKSPYLHKRNKALSEKYFEKVNSQIWKKLNKISFLESKNFTGVRWIEFKSSNNTELKRMMDSHLGLLSDFLQKNFLDKNANKKDHAAKAKKPNSNSYSENVVQMNLPEIIVDSYQYFYSKINELKKFFSKFYLFKAIGKFNICVAARENYDVKALFAENLKNGKITIKTLLENLKDIYSISLELIKAEHIAEFAKALKKLLLISKIIPGM
jgi:hypothetical protein